jgi:hypothetical protein
VLDVARRMLEERMRVECSDQRPLPNRRDRYEVMEVTPRRREERRRAECGDRRRDTVYLSGGGSLHKKDDKGRRQRRKEQGEPVIVYAEPRRGKTYHC